MNPDIKEEREKVGFNVEEFTNWYFGGKDNVEKKRYLENFFLDDPDLNFEAFDMRYLSHKEKYEEGVRRATIMAKKGIKLLSEGKAITSSTAWVSLGMSILPEGSPLALHYFVFLPALQNLGTTEQQDYWMPKAMQHEIIGTYAQTELGHGTYVRGLETTATFDPKTKEFVIHSPTITAYKWWPGGLGHTANYAVVMAQLYTHGKCHGINPFIVPLRDSETHKPLKGITIGEIGAKIGMNTANNGFLGFDNVRIPLNHMLMKNAQVLENGDFVKPKSSVLNYGTMTYLRCTIVEDQVVYLTRATTIAMRYSLVRRQSPIDPNQPEPKIIEHVTQQMKIFPAIAKVLAIKAAAESLFKMHGKVNADIDKGNLDRLPELHALSCCLKAVCSKEATQAVEVCRLSCGGHGYLESAGFGTLYTLVTASQTYEGENTVLLLQTARYLMKAWGQALKGQDLPPTVAYLKTYASKGKIRETWGGCQAGMLRALQATAAGKIASAFKSLENRKKFCSPEEAANQTGIELTKAAELHCQVFLLRAITENIEKSAETVSESLNSVLDDILKLYTVDLVTRYLGDILQFVNLSSNNLEALHESLEKILKKLRFNAIGIVDGFDISDKALGSTIGAYDGNVYERLLNAAKKSPLNQEDVNKSFDLYLKPFLKSNL